MCSSTLSFIFIDTETNFLNKTFKIKKNNTKKKQFLLNIFNSPPI